MTPATRLLDQLGVVYQRHTYDSSVTTDYAHEAASALSLDPAQVFKTLIVKGASGAFAVGLVPTHKTLSMKSLARHWGEKKVGMAEIPDALRLTGYVQGGISPFGQKTYLPTYVDDSATSYPTIYVSGGRRGLEIELAAQRLADVCEAIFCSIAS